MKKIGLVFLLFLFMPSFASADIIRLKNGKIVEGRIIEERSYAIKVQSGKYTQMIYRYMIDKIITDEQQKKIMEKLDNPETVSPKKRELVLRLFEVNGSRGEVIRVFDELIEKAPFDSQAYLRSLLIPDEVIEKVIPLYANNYTEEELEDLIRFYSSPTGSKHLKLAPQIMGDILKTIAEYFKGKTEFFNKK